MIWTALPGGALEFCNGRHCEFTGVDAEQSVTTNWPGLLHPDDLDSWDDLWQRDVPCQEPFELECRLRSATCGFRWVKLAASPCRDEAGAVQRWLGTTTDIEPWRRAQIELRDVSRRKDEFLAMLGHELRNPLAPIVTALELMKLKAGHDPFCEEHDVIERQVHHLAGLVNDMLDISRITRGRLSLKKKPVELRAIVARAVELASPLLEERRHRMEIVVPEDSCLVDGDPSRLAQVLANLLTNAAKFTAPGGWVRVTADCRDDASVVVTVADNGRGIAPEHLNSIFEPFKQGTSQASDRSEGGIGLGLAIVKNIVELHDGEVIVNSSVGRGSEFSVVLPMVRSEAESSEVSCADWGEEASGERILVVDDNRDAAITLTEYLQAVGYDVTTAYDGPSALEKAESFQPTVALLDIGLPVMDGYELAAKLRRVANDNSIRLIAVTGYGQSKDFARARAAGFDEHLVKPVDLTELLRLLPTPRESAQ